MYGTPDQLEGLRVLVVDDSPDNRFLISRFLQAVKAHVETAENGLEAVEKAQQSTFHIILMDMQMPVMDGLEATRQLRSRGVPTPVIALTAHALPDDRDRCLEAGCMDHLTKPIDRQLLIDKVAAHARLSHGARD